MTCLQNRLKRKSPCLPMLLQPTAKIFISCWIFLVSLSREVLNSSACKYLSCDFSIPSLLLSPLTPLPSHPPLPCSRLPYLPLPSPLPLNFSLLSIQFTQWQFEGEHAHRRLQVDQKVQHRTLLRIV